MDFRVIVYFRHIAEWIAGRLMVAAIHAVKHIGEEIACLLLTGFFQKVIHIRTESADILHAKIIAAVFDELMGADIIKVFGGCDLGGIRSFHIHMVLFHQLNEAVQLGRNQEGIDRIGKQNEVSLFQHLGTLRKILLIKADLCTGIKILKRMIRIEGLQIKHGLQGDTVQTGRGSVEYCDFHRIVSVLSESVVSQQIIPCGQRNFE